jgi:cytochrome c
MNRQTLALTSAAFVYLLCAACTPGEPTDPGSTIKGVRFTAAQIEQGRIYYEQTCAACHGIDGQGQFPEAPLERDATGRYGAPPHNEAGHTWHHTDELLVRYVVEGGFADARHFYTMPSFGGLYDRDQAAMIIAYIKTMWTEEQRIYQHHMTAEEEALFAQTQP